MAPLIRRCLLGSVCLAMPFSFIKMHQHRTLDADGEKQSNNTLPATIYLFNRLSSSCIFRVCCTSRAEQSPHPLEAIIYLRALCHID